MLKIRLMGTKNDIKWFSRILERNKKVNVLQATVSRGQSAQSRGSAQSR
jgi:hypothetical protein